MFMAILGYLWPLVKEQQPLSIPECSEGDYELSL